MNKIFKNLISGFTTLSLCTAMIGIPYARADDAETSDSTVVNRKLYVDFMGRGSVPNDTSPGKAKLNADDIGKEFWVGVAVDKVHDLSLFTDGVYSLEIAFEYDPEFLEPYTTTVDPDTDWQTELKNGNLSAANSAAWWNENQYEIISVRSTDLDTVTDRENKDLLSDRTNWRMCTVCVTFKDGEAFTDARFQGLTEETKQYLLKLPFKLKKVPSDTDADQNPAVLSLVRGPETLDIGSGENGTDPYSAWEATVADPNDLENMKTLFTFDGDISLFDAGASITDIVPVKPKTGEETEDTTYTLSQSDQLQGEGFEDGNAEYYLSVPNETEKLKLNITASDAPTVKANDTSINAALDSGQLYVTDEFALAELDKDINNGFNNTVTVESGSTTYTIHIRRLLKPKIVLNYGNSPYGEIMKAENIADEDKQAAKDAFDVNNKYDSLYLPSNVSDKASMKYTTYAWNGSTDSDENMDRNDYALFIYEKKNFKDSGFKATDSMGEEVAAEDITREIEFYRLSARNLSEDLTESIPELVSVTGVESDYIFTEITNPSLGYIRPDVYDMEYTFTDPNTNEKVSAIRKIVVILLRGDTNIDNSINGTDQTAIVNKVKGTPLYDTTTVPESTANLFVYRTVDTNMDGSVNGTDQTAITNKVKGQEMIQFYKEII